MARTVSEGAKSTSGGDWGEMDPGQLRTELRQAIDALRPGQLSDVIEAGDEFYIDQTARPAKRPGEVLTRKRGQRSRTS